jgi:hypothetical protein
MISISWLPAAPHESGQADGSWRLVIDTERPSGTVVVGFEIQVRHSAGYLPNWHSERWSAKQLRPDMNHYRCPVWFRAGAFGSPSNPVRGSAATTNFRMLDHTDAIRSILQKRGCHQGFPAAIGEGCYLPTGARRRNSSKKLSRNVRCVGGLSPPASSLARIAARRLPSGARS